MIKPTYVSSSNLDAVGFQRGTLYIRFNSGESYSYESVPFAYYDSMVNAESAGKFFHQFIRGKFPYTRLESNPFSEK